MSIEQVLYYECTISRRTLSGRNDYGEPSYTTVDITADCYINYPKKDLKDFSDRQILGDALLFTKSDTDIQINDLVSNIVTKTGDTVDTTQYIVKSIKRLGDENGLHHLEIDLVKG